MSDWRLEAMRRSPDAGPFDPVAFGTWFEAVKNQLFEPNSCGWAMAGRIYDGIDRLVEYRIEGDVLTLCLAHETEITVERPDGVLMGATELSIWRADKVRYSHLGRERDLDLVVRQKHGVIERGMPRYPSNWRRFRLDACPAMMELGPPPVGC